MSDLREICREAADGIAGATVPSSGGIRFQRRGFEARVDFPAGSTDILYDTRELAVESIQVAPAGLWHDLKSMVGRHDFQLDDPEFDASFEVATSSGEFARKVLSPAIQGLLRNAALFGRFVWRLSRAGFLFRAPGWPRDRVELDRWLVVSFQLLDALPTPPKPVFPPEAKCQVCGMPLAEGKVVICRRCATPHHKDCWEFNGRCSTFACGEIGAK